MSRWGCACGLWLLAHAFRLACAALTNRTIDDYYGDSVTGVRPVYSSSWNYGPNCTACEFRPNASDCYNGTWHDVTANESFPNVTLEFTGTAIYIFGVIPPPVPGDSYTTANLTFTLNDNLVHTFLQNGSTSSTAYEYNVLVYVNDSMPNDQYTLKVEPQYGKVQSYFAFDYAIYTFDDSPTGPNTSTTSSPASTQSSASSMAYPAPSLTMTATSDPKKPSHTGAIVGGIIGGVAAIIILALVVFCFRRRRHGYAGFIRQLWHGHASGMTQDPVIKPPDVIEDAVIESIDIRMSQQDFAAGPSLPSPPRSPSPVALASRWSHGFMDFIQQLRQVHVLGVTQDAVIQPLDVNEAVVEPFDTQHAFAANPTPASPPRSLSPMISASRLSHGFMDYIRQLRHGHVSGITQDADIKRLDLNEHAVITPFEAQMSQNAFAGSPSLASPPRSPSPVGSAARFSTSDYAPQRQQLTYQVREMERTVTDLKIRRGEEVTPPSTAQPGERGHTTDATLMAQLEALQREVERLRAAQEEAMAPPPPY